MLLEQLKLINQMSSKKLINKDLLVLGNGPGINHLNINKVIDLVKSDQLELIVVNSFFSQCKIEIPDISGVKYFYLDTQIIPLFALSPEEIKDQISLQALNSADASHSQTLLTYVMDSAISDINSIYTALSRKNTQVYMHPKFKSVLKDNFVPLSILPYQKVIRSFAPILSKVLGFHGLSNYFGVNVMNSAIMYGVNKNYRRVFVIGHGGRVEYKIRGGSSDWCINYPYFYDTRDNWYPRIDNLPEFGRAYLKHRLGQFKFPKKITSKVRFLGNDHDNYALMSNRSENEIFLNV